MLFRSEKYEPVKFQSSHWEEPNIVAHARIQDRDTPTGKAMHIEEIQSDWHQAGRKQGYATKLSSMPEISADDLYNKYYDQLDQYQKHYLLSFMKAWESAEYNGRDEELNSLTKQYQDWTKSQSINNGIPDAPFKKNWQIGRAHV